MSTTTAMLRRRLPTLAREWLVFWLLLGPNLLLFGIFTFWPLVYNAYLSLRLGLHAPREALGRHRKLSQREDVAAEFEKGAEPVVQDLAALKG